MRALARQYHAGPQTATHNVASSGKERLPSYRKEYGAINVNVATSTQALHEQTGGGGGAPLPIVFKRHPPTPQTSM
jgi:hypothetical protein